MTAAAAAPATRDATPGDTDVGAVLKSGKPYFPMLLGSGIEANRFGGLVRANRTPKAPPRIDAAYLGLFDCLTDEKEPGETVSLPSQRSVKH